MKPAFERAKVEPMTPELFREMCETHDINYRYSDDSRVYAAGSEERRAIYAVEGYLSGASEIWNAVVRAKLPPAEHDDELWGSKSL